MSSEGIVVLVLIVLAMGFVIWVRKNSHDHDRPEQAGELGREGEQTHNKK